MRFVDEFVVSIKCMIIKSASTRARRRCTMIGATILLCYLFTCCTHLSASQANSQDTQSPSIISSSQLAVESSRTREEQLPIQINKKDFKEEEEEHLKRHNVHKLMSEQDLRRTFQVDSHDQVPEYEILKLTVNDDGSHLISPISDLGELTATTTTTTKQHRTHIDNHSTTKTSNESSDKETTRESSKKRTRRKADDYEQLIGSGVNYKEDSRDNEADAKVERAARSECPKGSGSKCLMNEQEKLEEDVIEGEKMNEIVMKLSTFGKDFKLRLKRNVDFQQRIKDMKMFMAESTKDGQLRYTEIKSHQAQQHSSANANANKEADKKKHQEPQKRAALVDQALDAVGIEPSSSVSSSKKEEAEEVGQKKEDRVGSSSAANVWNIGSTYHDEDNLAALLIDHDRKTGQFQVDGTIGNDFVIKPMPRATIDAVALKQQQQQDLLRSQQWQSVELSGSNKQQQPKKSGQEDLELINAAKAPAAMERAMHLHDDDPHDDDEMFLDEDEALELAQLSNNKTTTTTTNHTVLANPSVANEQVRTLSKAASERKWKKYRKLMAQTQVPKPEAIASAGAESSSAGRARRHAHVQVSHHIVYRQRPSAEGSSAEHKHSFMVAPQEMEQLAASFSAQRLVKRSTSGDNDNMIDSLSSEEEEERLARLANIVTDAEHDPLGGQFYLEPGSVTGVERAGYADWTLQARRARAPPPYALNATDAQSFSGTNSSSAHASRRYKRSPRPSAQAGQVRRKRQAPDTVWPEVLLVVDYDSFLLHGGDSRDVKRYFVSFWNGVDLRYKLLVHPHIRISLAGMIVAKDRDATPYLERNRLRAPNADAVDAAGALTDMGKYLYREDRLPTYDLAVVITKLDMCRRRYEGGRCNRGTAGFAYVGGACVVNKRLEKVNSVAIIEDSGGFSGIIVAAHEVGHLLGCVHDGSPPPSYLGGPGATHCPWEDGFIMSDLRHTERGFRWSQCSVEQFKHFLNGETATCLYNYPHESQMLHRLLPGTMLSLDEQCKRDRGTNACFKDARVCAQLFCFDSASGYCVSYRPAAEGSPCGEGQVCRNGKCVGEIENIIPDYTHQSQTVVARRPNHSVSRLADNGLSASSTSTATSSPDNKLANPTAQISSRMDTFPVDRPLSRPTAGYSTGSTGFTYGGRYGSSTTSADHGLVLKRQGASASTSSSLNPMKSAKLVDYSGEQHYQQRSGYQAIPKQIVSQTKQYLQSSSNPHSSSALYTSASTISHHQYPTSSTSGGNNNLLTSPISTNSIAMANKKQQQQQQQQQQLYDNQRIMYQPVNQLESHYKSNLNNNNHHVNRNYVNGPNTSTSKLYNSQLSQQQQQQHQTPVTA